MNSKTAKRIRRLVRDELSFLEDEAGLTTACDGISAQATAGQKAFAENQMKKAYLRGGWPAVRDTVDRIRELNDSGLLVELDEDLSLEE